MYGSMNTAESVVTSMRYLSSYQAALVDLERYGDLSTSRLDANDKFVTNGWL